MKSATISLGILAWLLFWSSYSYAETQVFETAKGSATVVSVSISTTSGAVQIDARPSRNLNSRFAIELCNDDLDDNVRCSFSVDVSTISTNSNFGRLIPARIANSINCWTVAIPDVIPVYCRVEGSGTAAAAIVVATQLY